MPENETAVGDELELTIADIAFGGDGVGRTSDGLSVFVPFTAVGEKVRVRITQRKKRFARGEIVDLLKNSPERRKPSCMHFGTCGGCDYQHLSYEAEITAKSAQLTALIARIGHVSAEFAIAPIVPSPQPLGYRNKLVLQQCKPYPESGPGFGYVGRDKRTVLPIGACPLASEGINARLANTYLQPDERTRMEKHKRVTIREDATKRVYLSTGPTRKPRKVKERALDRELMLPLENFWQVNPTMFHRILVHIKELVIQRKPTTLLDLYCGSGAFALALADLVRHVCGVESHSAAVGAARACATRFALDHCTFIHGKTEDILDDVLTATPELQTSFAILDPPRAGCQPGTIDALRASPVATLAYVACDAARLARDLNLLCADGVYTIDSVGLFDMFPRTAHFESVAILTGHPSGD